MLPLPYHWFLPDSQTRHLTRGEIAQRLRAASPTRENRSTGHWVKRRLLLGLLLLGLPSAGWAQPALPAPAWQVVTALGDPLAPFATATDEQGDVYLAGSFYDSLRLGPFQVRSAGGEDGFVAKWQTATKTFAWVQHVAGPQRERVVALTVAHHCVYVVGSGSSGQVQLGPLALPSPGLTGNEQAFVAKLTTVGATSTFTWAQTLGNSATTASTVAVLDSSLYVGGTFYGTATFGPTVLPDRHGNSLGGGANGFLAKFTDGGRRARCDWAQPVGVGVGALAVTATGVYLAGAYQGGSAEFDNLTLPNYGSGNLYVAKLTDAGPQGRLAWVQQTGDLETAWVGGLAVVGSNVYVGGSFFGRSLRFGSALVTNTNHGHGTDMFVAKLTDAGPTSQFSWALQAGGNGHDECHGLAANATGVYLTGTFSSAPATFGACQVLNQGGADAFATQVLDEGPTARFSWAQRVGGAANDESWSMAVSGARVYVAATLRTPVPLATGAAGLGTFLGVLETPPADPTPASASASEWVMLSPNPAREVVTLQVPPQTEQCNALFQLYDPQGRLVRSLTQTVPRAGLEQTWALQGLASGLYILRGQVGTLTTSQYLVIE